MSDELQPLSERPTDPAPPSSPLTPDDVAELVADLSARVDVVLSVVNHINDTMGKVADAVLEIHTGFRIMKREHEELRARLTLVEMEGPVNGTH